MRTIQMTLDEELVAVVDAIAKAQHTTRSAFTREALRVAVERYRLREQEQRQIAGYRDHPVKDDEFSAWESEQEWGEG